MMKISSSKNLIK